MITTIVLFGLVSLLILIDEWLGSREQRPSTRPPFQP